MKNIKKILLGIAITGLLLSTVSLGTFSWFTSEVSVKGQMVNGTLEINNGEEIEEALFDGDQFAPSQLEYGNWISISNTGDMDANLEATYLHEIDRASLEAYEVGYMAMKYTVKPGQDDYEDSKIALDNLFNGTTNERSASTFYASTNENLEVFGEVLSDESTQGEIILGDGDQEDFWKLEEGQYIDVMIGLKLDESAGNEYQGAVYSAQLTVTAKQTDNGAKAE